MLDFCAITLRRFPKVNYLPEDICSCMEGLTTKDTIGIPAKPSDFVGGGYVGGGGIKSIKFGAILGIPQPFSSMLE